MNKISDVIVAPPILPGRFVSDDFSRFLFFDFSLRGSPQFLDEIQTLADENSRIQVFYAHSLELLAEADRREKWSTIVSRVDQSLDQRGEPYGLVIADLNSGWLLAQHSPVEWGVFAVKSNSRSAQIILDSMDSEDFLSVDEFRAAKRNANSRLHDCFDREFIDAIINNY
jgi:hypothetical protein